jgi:hypothetical protein
MTIKMSKSGKILKKICKFVIITLAILEYADVNATFLTT